VIRNDDIKNSDTAFYHAAQRELVLGRARGSLGHGVLVRRTLDCASICVRNIPMALDGILMTGRAQLVDQLVAVTATTSRVIIVVILYRLSLCARRVLGEGTEE
jgi:hypothetical protein